MANLLAGCQVVTAQEADLMRLMAGYRNRLVHFYHEVSDQELLDLCQTHLADFDQITAALKRWYLSHPDRIDRRL